VTEEELKEVIALLSSANAYDQHEGLLDLEVITRLGTLSRSLSSPSFPSFLCTYCGCADLRTEGNADAFVAAKGVSAIVPIAAVHPASASDPITDLLKTLFSRLERYTSTYPS
jgi:hypothetical protein